VNHLQFTTRIRFIVRGEDPGHNRTLYHKRHFDSMMNPVTVATVALCGQRLPYVERILVENDQARGESPPIPLRPHCGVIVDRICGKIKKSCFLD